MLRIGFLPSVFNPMLLMLGEQEDLRALGGMLRQFARDGGAVRLEELPFCAASGTRVTLAGGAVRRGCMRCPMNRVRSCGGWMRSLRRHLRFRSMTWQPHHARRGRSCWSARSRRRSR